MNTPQSLDSPDFSLVLGGPLFQLWRRAHPAGDALTMVGRRMAVLTLLAWAPLLVLSIVEGVAWGSQVKLPFLYDVELHVRFLLALPLLVAAELLVHQRLMPTVRQFVNRGVVSEAARPGFDAAVAAAMKLRNSVAAEVLLIAFVYLVGVGYVWRTQIALAVSSWYSASVDGGLHPSAAGWWFGLVSLPIFQFLLIRWYFRLFVWTRFLWQVSRIDLTLFPTHPDRSGGLGFLSLVGHAFSPLLLAQGTLVAGTVASRIFYAGAKLPEFRLELIGATAALVFVVLGPMLVFAPKLAAAKRAGLGQYGNLAELYVREFDRKWMRGGAPADEALIGSADIQSLADLGNAFEVVKGMRLVPFTWQTVVQLSAVTLAPVVPLMLTMISLEELVDKGLKLLF